MSLSPSTAPDANECVGGQRCTGCGESKPLKAFPLDRKRKHGHASRCRACKVEAQRRRRARNPGWYARYAEKGRERARAHYEADPDAYKERAREWERRHPERHADIRAGIQARRRGVKKAGEVISRARVFKRDNGLCGICGLAADPDDFHLDHVRPLSRGGEHTYDNVQTAHPSCNRRKGARE